ncbi:MAG: ADOP family duplicated permease [Candidatus Acidiferrales bacterium]
MRSLFLRNRLDRELDEELRLHLELEIAEEIAVGKSCEEARTAALRTLGGVEQLKEECRDSRGVRLIQDFVQDLRYGLRIIARAPVLSFVIVTILAIGIGSATAIYSLIDACLLHSNTYPVVDRWEAVHAYSARQKNFINYLSVPDILEVKSLTDIFEAVGAVHGDSFNLTGGDYPERILGTHATANAIAMTAVAPILGRIFTEQEDRLGGPPVVVISAELWQRRFASDPNILGQVIRLNTVAYTVIGVMPAHFDLWGGELWIPLQINPADPNRSDRQNWIVAVLRKGVTEKAANARLAILSKQLDQQYGAILPEYRGWDLRVWNINEAVIGGVKPALLVLACGVGLLLLISCANVAVLLLARGAARMREVSVRLALGAGRRRILRQLLTESLVLSVTGGVLGVCVCLATLPALVRLIPVVWLPTAPELVRTNLAALAVATGIAIAMGALFGIVPAWQASRQDLVVALKEGGGKIAGDRAGRSARNWLVVAEIALSLMVLAGAALTVESYRRVEGIDLGFRPGHLLTFSISLPETKYPGAVQIAQFFDRALDSISSVPGVESAAVGSGQPMIDRSEDLTSRDFSIEGRPSSDARGAENANFRIVSNGYFRTMGVRLLAGRTFSAQDGRSAPRSVVINDTMARLYWPNGGAVGHRILLGQQFGRREAFAADAAPDAPLEIVGVVSDVRQTRVIEAPVGPEFYLPLDQQQSAPRIMAFAVRGTSDPAQLTPAIRKAIAAVDVEQPIYDVNAMEEAVADAFGPKRLTLFLLVFLGVVALLLSSVGLYALISYSVSLRRHEIGIRLAIGAQPAHIRRLVLRQGLRLAALGVALGVAGALAATRLMQEILYGVSASDPLTLLFVAAALFIAALLACYIPSRNAVRVDPMIALRHE